MPLAGPGCRQLFGLWCSWRRCWFSTAVSFLAAHFFIIYLTAAQWGTVSCGEVFTWKSRKWCWWLTQNSDYFSEPLSMATVYWAPCRKFVQTGGDFVWFLLPNQFYEGSKRSHTCLTVYHVRTVVGSVQMAGCASITEVMETSQRRPFWAKKHIFFSKKKKKKLHVIKEQNITMINFLLSMLQKTPHII